MIRRFLKIAVLSTLAGFLSMHLVGVALGQPGAGLGSSGAKQTAASIGAITQTDADARYCRLSGAAACLMVGPISLPNDGGINAQDTGGTSRQTLVGRAAGDNSTYLDGGVGGTHLRTNNGTTNNLFLGVDGTTQFKTSFIVSGLPTCNAGEAGAMAYVTDGLAPVYSATLTGGGAIRTIALCNGTNWTAH